MRVSRSHAGLFMAGPLIGRTARKSLAISMPEEFSKTPRIMVYPFPPGEARAIEHRLVCGLEAVM